MGSQNQPEASKNIMILAGAAQATASVGQARVRTRANFAVQHLIASARFSRLCGEVESAHTGQRSGPFYEELISYTSSSIITAAAGLEAYANELFFERNNHFPEFGKGTAAVLWEIAWPSIERKNPMEKYDTALLLRGKVPLASEKEGSPTRAIRDAALLLIHLRDALMHFKPHWDDEDQKQHGQLTARLKKQSVQPSPFVSSAQPFPNGFMSHSMTTWAVLTALRYTATFSQRAGLENKYVQHIERLNPGLANWPSGVTPPVI